MSAGPAALVLGGFPRITVPVARSLAARGIPVYAGGFFSAPRVPRSRSLRGYIELPGPGQSSLEAFPAALLAVIEQRGIDTVIPVGDGELTALSGCEDRLASRVHRMYPSAALAARVLDKGATLTVARSLGVPIPESICVGSAEDFRRQGGAMRFPVFVKPRDRGRPNPARMRYFDGPEPLFAFLDAHRGAGCEWLVQRFVPGEGVGVEVLMDADRPLAIFQHRRLKELPPGGGVAVRSVSEAPDPVLVERAVALLRALSWEGLAMVEFRRDPATGHSVLMEINGRCWGSMALPIACGVDFPYYAWQRLHGLEPDPPATYPIGRRMRWLGGELQRLPAVLRESLDGERGGGGLARDLGVAVLDSVNGTRDALWAWGDPWPALQDTGQAVGLLVHQLCGRLVRSPRS